MNGKIPPMASSFLLRHLRKTFVSLHPPTHQQPRQSSPLGRTSFLEIIRVQFPRLICIETNEFEKVFVLGGESLSRLVKLGFYTGAIDRVMAGGVQERQKIVSILGDLQNVSSQLVTRSRLNIVQSLDFLMNLVKNLSQLSEGTICPFTKLL